MKVTILTQYYLPETGAPQNRLGSLAKHLVGGGHKVTVITAMPNYPMGRIFEGYRGKLWLKESIDGADVWRSWILASRSRRFVPRLLGYASFVITSMIAGLRAERSDILICESPPLFLGISAVLLARLKHARLVLNVSDLWPATAERLGIVNDGLLLRLAYRLESWLYRKSWLVAGQTHGIVDDIRRRFPAVRTFWSPNGMDRDCYDRVTVDSHWRTGHGLADKKLFIYAGVLGHAQGLQVIIGAAARLRHRSDLAMVIMGDGPLKEELQKLNERLGARVIFLPNMTREAALAIIAGAYACIIPLRKTCLFKGAVPSKIFDPLALGIPILLGVEGEAKELFIERGRAGLAFDPENDEDLAARVQQLSSCDRLRKELGENGRAYVRCHFDHGRIVKELVEQLTG